MSATTDKKVWFDPVTTVTGSSTGLGRALVEALLEHGERVAATARSPDALASLKEKATSPSQLLILKLDVTKTTEINEAFQSALAHFGRVDVVVNNAGYGLLGEFESYTQEQMQQQMNVNLWGVVNVTQVALRIFREVNKPAGGRLLQISSTGGFTGVPGISMYNASKFAVEGFSESVQKELKPEWNIHVTIVQPGGFANTDWAGRSMVRNETMKGYEGGPASVLAKILTASAPEGDPAKAAAALIKIAYEPKPPMKLPLGTDCVGIIRTKLQDITNELNQWEWLSNSTARADYKPLTPEDIAAFLSKQ